MAIITVTNGNDSGPGSLRQAIIDASSGDNIEFYDNYAITLFSGNLSIGKNLVFNNLGKNITITSNNGSNIFNIQTANSTVRINGFSILNGYNSAIINSGKLIIINSMITGNAAVNNGGAIINDGILTVMSSKIAGNSATSNGGAIFNNGTFIVSDSTIAGNSAASNGGAIFNNGILTITSSTISGNYASGDGGVIFNEGIFTITNTTISANSATNGAVILNFTKNNASKIIFSTIANNVALIGASIEWRDSGGIAFKNSLVANNRQNFSDYKVLSLFGINFSTDATSTGFIQVSLEQLKLGPLTLNYPGSTETQALSQGSLAIGSVTDCTDIDGNIVYTDQRGVYRQLNAASAGAFEYSPILTRGITLL